MSKGGGGGDTVQTSSDIPQRYRDYVDQNLSLAETIANRPYTAFQGQRVAGFAPDQQAAFNYVRGLAPSFQQPLSKSMEAYDTSLSAFAPFVSNANAAYTAGLNSAADPSVMMQRYQNPYTESVVDSTISDINRSYDRAGEQTRLSSPFGGSRLALREAENERNRAQAIADAGAQLRSNAFTTAAGLGQNATNQILAAGDRSANLGGTVANTFQGAGDRYSGLGTTALNAGGTFADMLAGIGAQQQGLQQAGLDINYGDFLSELNYPLNQLSIRQSAIGQTPMGSVGVQPVYAQGGGFGSTLSGLGGLLGGVAQVAPLFCWVAREVYGISNPRWLQIFNWMLIKAPASLRSFYAEFGEQIAEEIADQPAMKARIRDLFDQLVPEGA